MHKDRTIVTVDGLAGSGKTTLSKLLAEKLGYLHFSTGLVYRSVALLCLRVNADLDSEESVMKSLQGHSIDLNLVSGSEQVEVLVDGKNVVDELYAPEVSEATSLASRHPRVRGRLLEMQRAAFPGVSLVVEGRDMGTVVFPNAQVKFFIQASEEVRLQRRLSQMAEKFKNDNTQRKALEAKMKIEILERDERDQKREHSPTIAAKDAIIIDNSSASLTEVLENMYDSVLRSGAQVGN